MAGPLTGIKVVDLSRILAGPWATQVLADFGAEVIKIERPQLGDDTRRWGPPYFKNEQTGAEISAYFLAANRGKSSVELDFTNDAGKQVLFELLNGADILVENYKVGGLKKYGLDYDSLKQQFPSLIYCSITGFGQTGPDAAQAGYDAMIQARGGLMSITGSPQTGPQKVGVAVTDLMTGMYAATAIIAALHHKTQTGQGQQIDLALLDCQAAMLANQGSNYLVSGNAPKPMGNSHPNIVPYQSFAVKNGHILLAVGNDAQFGRCCEVMGLDSLAQHPDYVTNDKRVANRDRLIAIMQPQFLSKNLDQWLTDLSQNDVPCGPINTLDRVFSDKQLQSRSMLLELEHAELGKVPLVANPVKFSGTPLEYPKAPPMLGEDNGLISN
ncbi:CaiB/BaiF CoA-transferase family protein [Paraferrimonas sp. SM1919]|uniref:CaiB/BaiF CoA transferase family protein n=1 Tax=Paraferrimonas sp. SM1919 TaxID=2662263 RepID=UPI0013D2F546|nr:CaiB/BaiF CoA-transferase family protein [Paraferrimonas sp. SM1919]